MIVILFCFWMWILGPIHKEKKKPKDYHIEGQHTIDDEDNDFENFIWR